MLGYTAEMVLAQAVQPNKLVFLYSMTKIIMQQFIDLEQYYNNKIFLLTWLPDF